MSCGGLAELLCCASLEDAIRHPPVLLHVFGELTQEKFVVKLRSQTSSTALSAV